VWAAALWPASLKKLGLLTRLAEAAGTTTASIRDDVCGVDRRCYVVVHSVMMRLVEKGLARRFKKGTYLIERAAVEEVLTALKEWI
jgi:predicted transcriptional regulator of viral defense system